MNENEIADLKKSLQLAVEKELKEAKGDLTEVKKEIAARVDSKKAEYASWLTLPPAQQVLVVDAEKAAIESILLRHEQKVLLGTAKKAKEVAMKLGVVVLKIILAKLGVTLP